MSNDDVVQVQLTEDGSRPTALPEQFKTVEDMVKSYTELQGAHTKLTQANATETTLPATQKPKEVKDGLTVEMRSAMQNISNFNEGQRKLRFEQQVGVEGLVALEDYISGAAIDTGMKAAYDAAIDSGNEALIDANFALIRSVFEMQNGAFNAPENVVAGAAGGFMIPAGTKPYESLGEQKAAQADPKYKTDTAFRESVEQRIAISGPYRY